MDCRARPERRRGAADRAAASVAAGGRRHGPGADELSHGEQYGLRQGSDQRLLGSAEGRRGGSCQGVCQHGGGLERRPLRGSCMSAAMGGRSRCSNWSITWTCLSRKPGALAGSRPLEQQRRAGLWPESFDRDVAGADGAAWQAERDQADDRSAETGQTEWPWPAASGDRDGAGDWLLRTPPLCSICFMRRT